MLHYLTIPVTAFQQNCSLVWCDATHKAAVIDPGGDLEVLLAEVKRLNLTLEQIWLTHAHIDHIGMIPRLVMEGYGGKIVATVLATPELRSLWEQELGGMRERIKALRQALVDGIHRRVPGADFSFVLRQRGMFSYSGLTKEQVARLRQEFSTQTKRTVAFTPRPPPPRAGCPWPGP